MTLLAIRAFMTCDGCGSRMSFDLDPAGKVTVGWSLFDKAIDACRGGLDREQDGLSSVQGSDKCLCASCTREVDAFVTEDRNATDDEIEEALEASSQ